MRRGSYFALILALAAASTATAQTPLTGRSPIAGMVRQLGFPGDYSKEAEEAKAFQRLRVSGRSVSRAVKKIRKLKWYSSLTKASHRAKRENKPIVWIQALGTLKGYT